MVQPPRLSRRPLSSERDHTLAYLVVYRPQPLLLKEGDLLEGLALQSALAVGNAQHPERTLEWERVQIDLAAARVIQRSSAPTSPATPSPSAPPPAMKSRATTSTSYSSPTAASSSSSSMSPAKASPPPSSA